MKRFTFHLESLLRILSHKEENWRAKLGEATSVCNAIRHSIASLYKEEYQTSAYGGEMSINFLHSRELYLGRIRNEIEKLKEDYVEAEKKREEVRTEYMHAQREYKAVQTIRDKRFAGYRKACGNEENKEIDDIVNARVARVAGGFGE